MPFAAMVLVASFGLAPRQNSVSVSPANSNAEKARPPKPPSESAGETEANATVWIAIFTVVLAGVGVAQGFLLKRQIGATRDTIALARKEFEAEHRPWLAIREVRTISITLPPFNKGQFGIDVEFLIDNIGAVPATDILMWHKVLSYRHSQIFIHTIHEMVDQYDNYKRSIVGPHMPARVLFPGARLPYPAQSLPGRYEDFSDLTPDQLFLDPVIVVVFCYKSPNDKMTHYTSGAYSVLLDRETIALQKSAQNLVTIDNAERLSVHEWMNGFLAA